MYLLLLSLQLADFVGITGHLAGLKQVEPAHQPNQQHSGGEKPHATQVNPRLPDAFLRSVLQERKR
jgi:hypothetical protein